jgi:hypothetical protein
MRRLLQVTANEDNTNVDFQVLSGIVSDYHTQVQLTHTHTRLHTTYTRHAQVRAAMSCDEKLR